MITYVKSNLFESPAKVLVNTVNTVGVMGKGIAKEFKAIYPEMFDKYKRFCETGQLVVGKLWLYKTPNKWILNFPTKTTWRSPSELDYIESGLKNFTENYAKHGITSIAFPPLGCGNGELNWESQVRPLMEKYLKKVPIDVFIHLYSPGASNPEHREVEEMTRWLRSEPQNLPFGEVWHDLVEIIGDGIKLKPLGHQSESMIAIAKDTEGAESISVNGGIVSRESLTDAWALLRAYGFVSVGNLPGELAEVSPEILALLSKLDYCPIIQLSSKYDDINKPDAFGVQLRPKNNPKFTRNEQSETIQI